MSSNLTAMCSAQAIPYPSITGVKFLTMSANVVSNYTKFVPDYYNFNHPNITVENANFCNITVSYTHPGENDQIYAESWLPLDGWNGRLQATGGGGWVAGRFKLSYYNMAGAIAEGYATITTDAGLGSATDASPWALTSTGNVNLYKLQNLGSVSLYEQSVIGKALINSFYGKLPNYSYFSGCSQGGRQGMMVAQRYPDAYDGIAASAPAINWDELIMNLFYPTLIMNMAGKYPAGCEFDAIVAAATAYCDAADGVADGVVSTLYDCDFDPYSVVGQTINCSTTGTTRVVSETAALIANVTWEGSRSANGGFLWYGLNYDANLSGDGSISAGAMDTTSCTSNGTCTSNSWVLPTQWIQYFIEKNPDYPLGNMTHETFDALFHAGKQQFDDIISANDPDLTAFKAAGGKLISYHGKADSIIPTGGSIHWHNAVNATVPGIDDFYRLFLIPGLSHCSGGAGGQPTTTFNSLVAWVENGTVPEYLPVSWNSSGTTFTRNICKFPEETVYDGVGDPSLASSFNCV
ncbi:carboxylic ester hydrolase-35 [Coleophoma cylindrospora]|uniref:Carboxylic ester hydrolase n=1 Tax=Coleophoma cylindrospora TaxID=1849047 RepID=A0A3D8RZB3_9HELO|nr:carboxylic ester hydrolase-35 [Coleophoma cylindrospora]